jgi:hypothetical protein
MVSKTGLLLSGLGGIAIAYGRGLEDKRARDIATAAGAAVLGFGLFRLLEGPEGLLAGAVGRFQGALASSSAVSHGEGVSAFEKGLGLLGRATGNEPEAGITTRVDRAADESKGPFLGTPKNALLVAGKIRSPVQGGELRLPLFADTVMVDAAVENQAAEPRAGRIAVRYMDGGEARIMQGPEVTLAPGEFREVSIRVPPARAGGTFEGDIALLFSNHTLDRVGFNYDRTFS